MTPERWCELERVYHLTREQAPDERAVFLKRSCNGDEELRHEVESLLNHEAGAGEFLGAAVLEIAARADDLRRAPSDTAGRQVGHYRLLQKIGEGGMGEVWLVDQKEPVRRRVALKLIKAGMNTREVIARFESERQALALMDHPAIAKVFDAGSTPQGTPYFVMEYIAGVPITAYCDNHRLTVRERLELFILVCEGVRHAHQKAIIHRDLKPSNILVTEVDGKALPKIIDFGVAKALTTKLTADTIFTRLGAPVGTPEYMSPEQALSSGEDIDTRTDVYSLGIVFYELLAGTPPLDLRGVAFDEFLRRLREEEPAKPSTKIRTYDHATATEIARNRRTQLPVLAKEVRGDLDLIVLKALEKDRPRRYGSAFEFAADIQRHVNNEAVLAVPPSAAYRARKFARRYRGVLTAISVVIVMLILAAGVSIWQSVRATKQRDRADAEGAAAQAVNDFLQNDLLAQASAYAQLDSGTKPDPDLKVRTALDRAAVRIAGKFDRQPEVEAAIRDTIGQTYIDLKLYPEARTQLERARDLHRRMLGAENPKTLKTISRLGWIALMQGNLPLAEILLSQAQTIQRRVLGSDHPETLISMNGLAFVFNAQGKVAQAEALYLQTLEIRRRVLGPEHPDTLKSMNALANLYSSEDLGKAEALHSEVLQIQRRVLGSHHPDTLASMHNLANTYFFEGMFARAEALHSQTLEIARRVLGSENMETLYCMGDLARDYDSLGKYWLSEPLFGQALEIQRRVRGPHDEVTLLFMTSLADHYAFQGRHSLSEALFRRTLEIEHRALGPDDYQTIDTLSRLASAYQRQGKYALAETRIAQALAGARRTLMGDEYTGTMDLMADLALADISQGKFAMAEPLAREVFDFYRKRQLDCWQGFRAKSLLGASLAGQKKYAEAEPLLLEGYQGMVARKHRVAVPDWYYLDRAREWIIRLYNAWGKPAKAGEFRNTKSHSPDEVDSDLSPADEPKTP